MTVPFAAWAVALALFPPTPAQLARYQATTAHAAVLDYCRQLDRSPRIHQLIFGTTGEGRALPGLVIAPTDITTPEQAAARNVPVVVAFANIHAGEVDGKEALLELARVYATAAADSPVVNELKSVTVILIPNLNADGNEQFGNNRPTQNGPARVGERANAQGLDLNRDFVKLESPEIRALTKLIREWDPVAVIDCHTTNGSYHRYTLTYDASRHPATGPELVAAGESLLARVQKRIKTATGYDTFPYGDFAKDHTQWVSYPALPRYGVQCFGLRGVLGVLSESYSYAPFADRVRASRAIVAGVIAEIAADPKRFAKLATDAEKSRPRVPVRTQSVPRGEAETVMGYVEVVKEGQSHATDTTKDYQTTRIDKVVATREVPTPAGYLIPPDYRGAVDTLLRHGVEVEEVAEEAEVLIQAFAITELKRAREFQGHKLVSLEGTRGPTTLRVRPGWFLVRTAQKLGNLAAFLLEPESEDGLAAWNAFDAGLRVGEPFPVRMLTELPRLVTADAAPVPEDRPKKQPVTVADLLKGRGASSGSSPGLPDWLDAEHFLQSARGKLFKVHARTGKSVSLIDAKGIAESLKSLGEIPKATRQQALNPSPSRMNPARTGMLISLESDLAFCPFDGTPAVRLSTSPADRAKPERVEFSPDGKRIAYVRAGDLYAVAIADAKEIRLTTDGKPGANGVLNGKADWVYEEEIFNRAGRGAYQWHPTEPKLIFLRLDDAPVKPFHLVSPFGASGELETIPYPKAGGANPLVSVHLADLVSGKVETLSLGEVDPKSTLVSRIGFLPTPTGTVPFAYVQNRTQTYLDFVTWPNRADMPTTRFREVTGAWVEDLGEPHPLPGGDFLILSERSGYKHLYRIDAQGKATPLTQGDWEVRGVERVDTTSGEVWVTTTRAGPTRMHLEAVSLKSAPIRRLSPEAGSHTHSVAPSGPLFVDRVSSPDEPAITMLRDAAGGTLRTLDSTPARGLDAYKLGKSESVEVPMPDGFILHGVLTYPPDFDPAKKYPLWILTYAGPHAPTVRGDYSPRLREQAIAAMGVVAFNIDPRSASGQGAKSAWVAYKRLYESELADLSAAVAWVGQKGWLDRKHVGLSGHSYGGSITAFALTHPSPFTAGVAGAPVTDWRLYDSIYTERYMLTPAENPAGYDNSSSVKSAAGLHGRLLICHGLIDDNVHFQNTAQLVESLEKAGKTDFEVAIYPSSRHGIRSSHYLKSQMDFIRRTMTVQEK